MTGRMLAGRIPVVVIGFPGRNTQIRPLAAAQRLRNIDDLADMVSDMRQRSMQRLMYLQRLPSNRDGFVELSGRRVRQGRRGVLPSRPAIFRGAPPC